MREHGQKEIRVVVDLDARGLVNAVYCNRPDAVVIYSDPLGGPRIEECGQCGHFHLSTFAGDCRSDDDRFVAL